MHYSHWEQMVQALLNIRNDQSPVSRLSIPDILAHLKNIKTEIYNISVDTRHSRSDVTQSVSHSVSDS